MKMRKIFLLLAGCFLGMFHASSQVIQEKRPISLNGVWQMCFYYSPSPDTPGQLRTSNSLKILSGDNRFCNLVMTPGGAVIIGYGTFGLTSDTFYTEYIEKNVHLPQLDGKENRMYFNLEENGRLMKVRYFVETDSAGNKLDTWYHEVWKKVSLAPVYPGDILR